MCSVYTNGKVCSVYTNGRVCWVYTNGKVCSVYTNGKVCSVYTNGKELVKTKILFHCLLVLFFRLMSTVSVFSSVKCAFRHFRIIKTVNVKSLRWQTSYCKTSSADVCGMTPLKDQTWQRLSVHWKSSIKRCKFVGACFFLNHYHCQLSSLWMKRKQDLRKKLQNSTTFIRTYSWVKYFVRKVYKQILQCQHQMMLSSTLWIIQESIHTQSGAVYALAL